MKHLLNLLAAISLLLWGIYLVRTGILSVFGANLRRTLASSMSNRFAAAAAGLGVTALVQSSTATTLIVSSFVGQGAIALPAALAVLLGADVGSAVMATVLSFDLSWVSSLAILLGVLLFLARPDTDTGRVGRVLIGIGLMLLALRLIAASTAVLTGAPAISELLASLESDRGLEITLGALLALACYSSLAIVLLTATLAATAAVPYEVSLGLVLGANLGSGILGVLTTWRSSVEVRQGPLCNLGFKVIGVAAMAPFAHLWLQYTTPWVPEPMLSVVLFHLAFNFVVAIAFIGLTRPAARLVTALLPVPDASTTSGAERPNHLDPSALTTPSLAISCAAREALYQADVVETMLRGLLPVIRRNDVKLSKKLRLLDDAVDRSYSDIKYYLTKLSRQSLGEEESRRWAEIMSFTINMEQVADIVERVLIDVEDKKIRKQRSFSDAGMSEIVEMHSRLLDNQRLAMSVFLTGNLRDARRLLEEKTRFRELQHAYANSHLTRLSHNTVQSVETSSLHIEIIGEFKRINSHLCGIAYPILDSAGVLHPSRLRQVQPAELPAQE